jgi:hypothetical protein
MAVRRLFLFISTLAMACCCAIASDPSLLQDFCVAGKMSQGTTKVVLFIWRRFHKTKLLIYCRRSKHPIPYLIMIEISYTDANMMQLTLMDLPAKMQKM